MLHTRARTHTLTGEGQFGRVFKALAEGICPQDDNRKIVAIKTLKGKTIQNLLSVCTSACLKPDLCYLRAEWVLILRLILSGLCEVL